MSKAVRSVRPSFDSFANSSPKPLEGPALVPGSTELLPREPLNPSPFQDNLAPLRAFFELLDQWDRADQNGKETT